MNLYPGRGSNRTNEISSPPAHERIMTTHFNTPKDGIQRLLTPLELRQLAVFNMTSRFTVEGQLQGSHPSPLKGFSVEFSDYRQYVPGDDLKHLDWRVFARSERLYLRQYEEECNLRAYFVVDGSKSMAYKHVTSISKYQYAARLAAALAYVTVHQHDSVGLMLSSGSAELELPAKGGQMHLRKFANMLADFTPSGEIDLNDVLHRLAGKIQRRALIVLLSDCFCDLESLKTALAHLRRRKHDVIIYQIVDNAEIDFPFHEFGRFKDMENAGELVTDPRAIRNAYLETIQEFLNQLRGIACSLDIDYLLLDTSHPPIEYVRHHLHRRMRM